MSRGINRRIGMLDHDYMPNIGIITPTVSETSHLFLSDFAQILSPLFSYVYVISGNVNPSEYDNKKTKVYSLKHQTSKNPFIRIFKFIYLQAWIAYRLALLRNKVDLWIFYLGGEVLIIPMITAKLLNKKVILVLGGFTKKEGQILKDSLYTPLNLLETLNFKLSNSIIIYSQNIIDEWGLEKYKYKILVAPRHFIDLSQFYVDLPLKERSLVGFIGRFSIEKGVLNFAKSIPKVLEKEKNVKIFLGGDGSLRDEILTYLNEPIQNGNVEYVGWVYRDQISIYLNKLKLIVVPSYTEGLPNIILEAMACGTVVLATSVGAIPSIIKDEETGFILENNSPDCITKNIIRALEHPELETIAENARSLIEHQFTHQMAVERYASIFKRI